MNELARRARDRETLEAVRMDEGQLFVAALKQAVSRLNPSKRALSKSEEILWFLRTEWIGLRPELRDALGEAQLLMAARESELERAGRRECVGERFGREWVWRSV